MLSIGFLCRKSYDDPHISSTIRLSPDAGSGGCGTRVQCAGYEYCQGNDALTAIRAFRWMISRPDRIG